MSRIAPPVLAASLACALLLHGCASGSSDRGRTAEAPALERLLEGNRRYVAGRAEHPRADAARRAELATTQRPFAVVLSCADSRVPPEVLFDQGIGDLFVVRVAGNVVSDEVLGSIEYAVEHLETRLVLVLGHERCGAVQATLAGGDAGGHVQSLVRAIAPHVRGLAGTGEERMDAAVRANVRAVAARLRRSTPVLKREVDEHGLRVAGARYDLDSGMVEILAP